MISYANFRKLRLTQFLPDAKVKKLDGWEFMGHLWIGEAIGFSEWLCFESTPEVLGSLAIDFKEFPELPALEVLRTIDLPVLPGMDIRDLSKVLGEPVNELRFTNDRVSYEFVVSGPPRYDVSCTVLNKGGLTYLVVMVPLLDSGG